MLARFEALQQRITPLSMYAFEKRSKTETTSLAASRSAQTFFDLPGIRVIIPDLEAAYSITLARFAVERNRWLKEIVNVPADAVILDGMACVGGDSMSFMLDFPAGHVYASEVNAVRCQALQENMQNVYNLAQHQHKEKANFTVFNESILNLLQRKLEITLLFLDPPWGGPEMATKGTNTLMIDKKLLEEVVIRAFETKSNLKFVVLKLPPNYDRSQIEQIKHNVNCTIETKEDKKPNGSVAMVFIAFIKTQ